MSLLEPLPPDATPELADAFATFEEILGFVPNSLLIMQRCPEIVEGFDHLTTQIMQECDTVDPGFKRLAAHMASHAAGCQYCEAHSLVAAELHDEPRERIEALWEYRDSELFSQKERVGLDFAVAAGSVPNAVDDELMEEMRAHWSDEEIVELLAAISLYGFLNRWNDTLATTLEDEPRELGEEVLADQGWDGAEHVD